MSDSSLGGLPSNGLCIARGVAPWLGGHVLLLILFASLIAIVAMLAAYLLGYSRGYANGRLQWKAVFEELRDFDESGAPRGN